MENKLLYGDCMKLMKKIPKKSCEMVLTDIPYGECNKDNYGHIGNFATNRTLDKGQADKLNFNLDEFVKECLRISYGSIYIFCGFAQISYLINLLRSDKTRTRLCIWEKPNGIIINCEKFWLSNIEACVFCRFSNATFNEKHVSSVWKVNTEVNRIHLTQKPLALFKYLIKTSSKSGSTILDPCAGSCTTAIAAMITGRKYICIENNLKAYKAAKLRIQVTEEKLLKD